MKSHRRRFGACVTWFVCLVLGSVRTACGAEVAPWEKYARGLASLEERGASPGLERVFEWGVSASDSLMQIVPASSSRALTLETLNDSLLSVVRSRMRGFTILVNESGAGVLPDWNFFAAQARRHGAAADREFFELQRSTSRPGGWPVWIEPRTDESGCTRFGALELVDADARWREFASRHPGHYARWVAEAQDEIWRALSRGDCCCGETGEAIRELQAFLERNSVDDPRAPVIRERIAAIRAGRVVLRERCGPN